MIIMREHTVKMLNKLGINALNNKRYIFPSTVAVHVLAATTQPKPFRSNSPILFLVSRVNVNDRFI